MRRAAVEGEELTGIVVMALAAVATSYQAAGTTARVGSAVAMVLAEVGLLAGRHARPVLRTVGLGGAVLAGFAALLLSPAGLAEIPILVAASRLPRTLPRRRRIGVLVAFSVLFGVAVAYVAQSQVGLLAGFGVWYLAERTMQGDALQVERDRAVSLLAEVEASRDAQAEAAAAGERARIAREMHDVLAHSLAGLSLQLQAARAVAVREGVGEAVTTPLEKAAALAREGVAEARAAVGALAGGPVPGGSGVEAVGGLVARFPGAATFAVSGQAQPLSPEAGHAVYRAVQESLTNASRYAPGARVSVALDWSPMQLVATVSDEGPAGAEESGAGGSGLGGSGLGGSGPLAAQAASTGAGLAGMAERLRQVGGRLMAGAVGSGWLVRIVVPTRVP